MPLLDILLAGPETIDRSAGSCRVRSVLQTLEGDTRQQLEAAMVKGSPWASTRLAKVLSSENMPISDNSINRHRNGECSCGR